MGKTNRTHRSRDKRSRAGFSLVCFTDVDSYHLLLLRRETTHITNALGIRNRELGASNLLGAGSSRGRGGEWAPVALSMGSGMAMALVRLELWARRLLAS
eukprot:9469260-Pyramimonas_sp.AAC.1